MISPSRIGFVVRLAAVAMPIAHSHHAPGCSSRGIARVLGDVTTLRVPRRIWWRSGHERAFRLPTTWISGWDIGLGYRPGISGGGPRLRVSAGFRTGFPRSDTCCSGSVSLALRRGTMYSVRVELRREHPVVATSSRPDKRTGRPDTRTGLGPVIADLLGDDLPVGIDCYDGSRTGPARRVDTSRGAVARRAALHPHRAGRARLRARVRRRRARPRRRHLRGARTARPAPGSAPATRAMARARATRRRLASCTGRRCRPRRRACTAGATRSARDAAAIAHHYDVSNDFYRLVLGPSMTYSCAVWPTPDATLEEAQAAKYELVCRKLGLRPGMRLLDVGCGWGGMVMHAARHHGVEAVGITLSQQPGRRTRAARRPRPGSTASRSASRTTATSTTAVRRDQLDRHVRARRAGAARRVLHAPARAARRRAGGFSTTGSAGRPRAPVALRAGTASSTATCSPTASCTRSARWSRDPASGLRGPARREPARALRAHAPAVGAQPRDELGRTRSPMSARAARASGGSTWRLRR